MSAKVPEFPKAQSGFLNDLVAAFSKRSKAIKHRVSVWEMEVLLETDGERLNIDFGYLGEQIRLAAWEDGVLWFRVCEGGKHGWNVNYSFSAQADADSTAEIVGIFEKSLTCSLNEKQVRLIWVAFDPQ